MADFGSIPSSFSSWLRTNVNNLNQVGAPSLTMPQDGLVSAVAFYAGGDGGSVTARGMVWNSSGGILIEGAALTVPAGSRSIRGQTLNQSSVSPVVYVANGTVITPGWWRDPAGGCVWSVGSGWTGYYCTNTSGSPGNFTGTSTYSGQIEAYVVYSPVSAPTATTQSATSIQSTSAVLNGAVSDGGWGAGGGGSSGWSLYLSTTPSGGSLAASGSFSGSYNPSTIVSGLNPSTTYYGQVFASNGVGVVPGGWVPFTTLAALAPIAETVGIGAMAALQATNFVQQAIHIHELVAITAAGLLVPANTLVIGPPGYGPRMIGAIQEEIVGRLRP